MDRIFLRTSAIGFVLTFALIIHGVLQTQLYAQNPTTTRYIGSTNLHKYRTLAVLSFSDAPNAPQSGQIAQGIANTILARAGFQVVERSRINLLASEHVLTASGMIAEQSVKLGQLLGVNAIVTGEVIQYQTIQRQTEPYYEIVRNPANQISDMEAMTLNAIYGPDKLMQMLKEANKPQYIIKPSQQWTESYVAVSLRVIDAETGVLIYSASSQYDKAYTTPPQKLLESAIVAMTNEWIRESERLDSSLSCQDKCNRMYNRGDLKAGVTISDCIQAFCN